MTRVAAEGARAVTPAEYRMLASFRRALRAFLHFSEQAARAAGLTPAQHQLLLAVKGAESERPPTIGEMAISLKLRPHSAVELVDRAASAGLLERMADPDDGRCQRLVVTTLGEKKLTSLSEVHREELLRFRAEMLGQLEGVPARRYTTKAAVSADAHDQDPTAPPEGGDQACWLDRVCPRCGRLDDGPRAGCCPGCGADLFERP